MRRRSFITMLAAAAVPAFSRGLPILEPSVERRFVPERRSEVTFSWIQVEVHLARSERAARGLRNREAHDPFDGLRGEFYISDAHPVDIPDGIPGSVTTYQTVVGVAAAKGSVHVGGFRRGLYVWVVRSNGGSPDLILDVADVIMGYDLPDETHARVDSSLLRALLPMPDDFSVGVKIAND